MDVSADVSELFKIWSEKSWKKFQVLSSVQGETSTGWSLHQALPKADISSISGVWGYCGEASPELSHCPSPGVSRGQDTQRTSVAIKLSTGADYPRSCLGGREGHTLCLDQRHASSYIGVC